MFGNRDRPTDVEAFFDSVAPIIEAIIPDVADLLIPHLLRRALMVLAPGYVPRHLAHARLESYSLERGLMPFLSEHADMDVWIENIETLYRFENGNYFVIELPEEGEDEEPEEILFSSEDFLTYLMYDVARRILDAWLYQIALTLYETDLFGAEKIPLELFDEAMLPLNLDFFNSVIEENDIDSSTAVAVLKEVKACLPPGSVLPAEVIGAFAGHESEDSSDEDDTDEDDDSGSTPPYSLN